MNRKNIVRTLFLATAIFTIVVLYHACIVSYEFIGENVRAEQMREQEKLAHEVAILQEELIALKEVMEVQNSRSLYLREKEGVYKHLSEIEEKALNIERMNVFYPQDLSVHLVPEFKNDHTDAIFDHARNIHVLANRFVRAQERLLFENYTTTRQQRVVVDEYYKALSEKIMTLCVDDRCDLSIR